MTSQSSRRSAPPAHGIAFSDAIRVWARIALLSFGGPAGQIALMHRILVEEKRWIGEARFLHALNFCMVLPGPEAQQLATYLGWIMHRTLGGFVAGVLFILPGFVVIMGLSALYALHGQSAPVAAVFFGLKAAVLAIVLQAVQRVGRRALKNHSMRAIAGLSFLGIFVLNLPFPVILVSAGLIGAAAARAGHRDFAIGSGHRDQDAEYSDQNSALGSSLPAHAAISGRWSLRIGACLGAAWLTPVAGLVWWLGPDDTFTRIALFFSQMAVVTFGGAYAVLAYVAQQVVETYGWLSPSEMLDGLGMAETTPGPLILVLQYVGFLAGFRDPHGLPPLLAGALAASLTVWVTFVPCFLWIFLGAPYIEVLRSNTALAGALAAITAAVVGVIANLAAWFALHAIFQRQYDLAIGPITVDLPELASLDPWALGLVLLAVLAIFRLRLGIVPVLLGSAFAGYLVSLVR